MVSASSREMIRAGSVGTRATYDEPYDSDGEETADTEWDEKGRNFISHIYVSYKHFITSIQFGYLNCEDDEALTLSAKFGHSEGHSFRAVILKEDEYVTGLSGVHRFGMHDGIKSLTFHTNCGEHGPIGSVNDNSEIGFKIDIDPGIRDRREFGGFFGSYSKVNLSSVGIYVSPIAREMIRAGQVKRRATWNLGEFAELWDVPDDTEWDDKGRTMISYIYVSFDRIIRSIQFGYYENEALVLSETYGSSDDHYTNLSNEIVEVKLGKDEYVTGLSGEVGLCEGIRNLTFHTNLGKHGPIGKFEYNNYTSGSNVIDPEIRDRRGFGGFYGSYNSNGLSSLVSM